MFTWPAVADIAAKFPLDIGPAYWLPRETGHAVDEARDASSIIEYRGETRRRHVDGERRKGWVFLHGDLAHERQDARIVELVRRAAVIGESTVEHGGGDDVGQTVIRRLLGIRRPFLLVTARYLVTPARGAYLDRGNAIESPDVFSERNAGGDRGLGRDMGRVGFQAALVDPKWDGAAAEGIDIHVGRPRD